MFIFFGFFFYEIKTEERLRDNGLTFFFECVLRWTSLFPAKKEVDLLARSNKKVKFISGRDDLGDGQLVDEKKDSRENFECRKTSFRDMVLVPYTNSGSTEKKIDIREYG